MEKLPGENTIMDIQDNHDGYHTFRELYECRHALFMTLVNMRTEIFRKCKNNSDGNVYEGWFLVSGWLTSGQISFHVPDRLWDLFKCKESLEPLMWDGHTTYDVINRLKALWGTLSEMETIGGQAMSLDCDLEDIDLDQSPPTKIPFEWEIICCDANKRMTSRVKVFGGWLIQDAWKLAPREGSECHLIPSLTFISDPFHAWGIE